MERILEISRKLATAESLDHLLHEIVVAAKDLTASESAGVLLEDPEFDALRFRAATTVAEQLAEIPIPVERSVAGAAFSSGEPVLVEDPQTDPRYCATAAEAIGREDRSLLAVPIRLGDQRIGVLEVGNKREAGRFGDGDVEVLTLLADQAAVAIKGAEHRGELADRIVRRSAELEAANERLRHVMAERSQAEMALRRQNAFLKATIDALPHPFYVINVSDYTIELANKAAGGDSLEASACYISICESNRASAASDCPCPLEEVRRTRQPVVVEHVRHDADGQPWYAAVHCYPVCDDGGEVVRIIEYSIDITEQRIAQAERERWLALLQSTLESTADGILVVDRDGQVILHNRRLVEMWDLPPGWADLVSLDERLPFPASLAADPEALVRSVLELYRQPTKAHRELVELASGRFFETHSTPFGAGEEILGRVWNFHDVTERVRAEVALRELNETLEEQVVARTEALELEMAKRERFEAEAAELRVLKEIDLLRSEFVSNVSHELRTPLGLIKVAATTLLAKDVFFDAETQQRLLEGIDTEADRLEDLISNLLTLSRVEQQRLLLNRRSTNLASLIRQTVDAQRSLPGASPSAPAHRFEIDLPGEELEAVVDPRRVEQVLRNLLSNAVKYSPAGSLVTIRARNSVGHALIEVRDEGIGIAAEDQERLFERFYRVETTATEGVSGVGLGLAISREIVESHGGRMWVESEFGAGSVFSFTLPLAGLAENLSAGETRQEVQ